jgi:hypothetical protein
MNIYGGRNMIYISEIQGWESSLPLLLKGRVGEGLRSIPKALVEGYRVVGLVQKSLC